jgi:hypothetical protein
MVLGVLLSIGAVYIVLAIALVHSIVLSGRLSSVSQLAKSFLTSYPPGSCIEEPPDILKACFKYPGQVVGFSCMTAVLAFGEIFSGVDER